MMADFISDCQRLLSEGKFSEALGQSNEQLKQSPKHDAVWRVNGFALQGLGRSDEAEESFKKAISYGKTDSKNYHAYAVLLFNMKRFDEALLMFETAMIFESTPEELFMVAVTNLMLGRQLDAILAMKEAIATNKDRTIAIINSFSQGYFQDRSVSEEDKKALKAQLDRLMRLA